MFFVVSHNHPGQPNQVLQHEFSGALKTSPKPSTRHKTSESKSVKGTSTLQKHRSPQHALCNIAAAPRILHGQILNPRACNRLMLYKHNVTYLPRDTDTFNVHKILQSYTLLCDDPVAFSHAVQHIPTLDTFLSHHTTNAHFSLQHPFKLFDKPL